MPVEMASIDSIQRMFYNGWTHGHYISNIFVFAPDGKIVMMTTNAPGCLHDSTLAEYGGIYDTLEAYFIKYNVRTVVDSAFSSCKNDYMIQSAQTLPVTSYPLQVLVSREATSLRKSTEWGMHGLKGSFPRLNDKLVYEERGERKVIVDLIVRLNNVRSTLVGINQIKSVFMPNLILNSDQRIHEFCNM